MLLQTPNELSLQKICSWMGYPQQSEIDSQTMQLAQQAAKIVLESAQPRGIYKKGCLEWSKAGQLLCDTIPLQGADIAHHLAGCTHTIWMAVTIGVQVDMQMRRLGKDMALVCAVDAAAGVLVERLADQLQQQIKEELGKAEYMTSRYSPGYGDFPIEMQKDVIQYLDASRKIGLTVSGGILIPRKSITALCGISDHPVQGHLAGCRHCVLRNKCSYRKEGKYCGKD